MIVSKKHNVAAGSVGSGISQAKNFAVTAIFMVMIMLASCGAPQRTASDEILVSPQWLASYSGDIVILDVARPVDQYLEAHIPGAVLIDRTLVWDSVQGLAGMLPDAQTVAADLADLGVDNDVPVVVYDSGNGLWAARVFWALEYLGHSQVHLLDGGFAAWSESGQQISNEVVTPQRGEFTANLQSELIADRQYILDNLEQGSIVVLDTRSEAEYDGEDVRSARGGHIPGSVNIEWRENLSSEGGFKTNEELALMYDDLVSEAGDIVALCQTGVRGAHTYVALRVLGYESVKVYDGSWEEWGNDDSLPIDS